MKHMIYARVIPWAQQVSTILVLETKLIFKFIYSQRQQCFTPKGSSGLQNKIYFMRN